MTVLHQRFCMHMKIGGGGIMLGYEILAADGSVIGTKSIRRAKHGNPTVTTFCLGEQEFRTVHEFIAAYEAQDKQKQRDQEWESAAP